MTPEWLQMMASYNAWQHSWINETCAGLGHEALTRDRGAFFTSILGTLSHLQWGDETWMSRFDGGNPPPGGIAESPSLYTDWASYLPARDTMNQRIKDWAAGMTPAECAGDLAWYSGVMKAHVTKPKRLVFTHFFNHQTHHRGQVHAMLTGGGIMTDVTDLFFMPDTEEETT